MEDGVKNKFCMVNRRQVGGEVIIYRSLKDCHSKNMFAPLTFINRHFFEYLVGREIAEGEIWEFTITGKKVGMEAPQPKKEFEFTCHP